MTTYDALTLVSNAQDISSTTSEVSESSYPVSVAPGPGGSTVLRCIGAGQPVKFIVHVTTTFSGSQEMTVQLILADNAALSSNVQVIGQSGNINTDFCTAGTEIELPIPAFTEAYATANGKAYLGLRYTLDGTQAAAAVSAWITLGGTAGKVARYAGNYTGP